DRVTHLSVPLEWEKLIALGAEARTWRSDAGRNTPFAVGDEVDPWQSDSGRITQLTVGAEVDSWQSDSG
ncbi:hypothetical protein P3828_32750, partial [Pseudomonas aeruginosa]|nr:hypothetical protein [Pseudomonas aeruginosa]